MVISDIVYEEITITRLLVMSLVTSDYDFIRIKTQETDTQ